MTIEQIVCTSDSICQLEEEALHCCRSADLWERKSVISLVVSLSQSHTTIRFSKEDERRLALWIRSHANIADRRNHLPCFERNCLLICAHRILDINKSSPSSLEN